METARGDQGSGQESGTYVKKDLSKSPEGETR